MKSILPPFLQFESSIDGMSRGFSVLVASMIIIFYSTIFEEEYSTKLIQLYIYPWWRILVILLVLFSAIWCRRVGILVALIAFFYLSDMNTLIEPIPNHRLT
jgi:predicted CDP-diglyceride synthetase/phosphatidate cytidylyltransferase